MGEERWRWVDGYEGLYMVSTLGDVMAAPHGYKDGKPLNQRKSNNGYLLVSLYKDGLYKHSLVHRLVAKAFIPNPEKKDQVNHKNGIKSDNRVCNLEWMTCSENIRHKFDVLGADTGKGRPSKLRKFTDEQVREIRADKRKPSVICLDYGCTRQCISDIQRMKFYKEVI